MKKHILLVFITLSLNILFAQEVKTYYDSGELREVFKNSKDGKYNEQKKFRKNGKLSTYKNKKVRVNFLMKIKL